MALILALIAVGLLCYFYMRSAAFREFSALFRKCIPYLLVFLAVVTVLMLVSGKGQILRALPLALAASVLVVAFLLVVRILASRLSKRVGVKGRGNDRIGSKEEVVLVACDGCGVYVPSDEVKTKASKTYCKECLG